MTQMQTNRRSIKKIPSRGIRNRITNCKMSINDQRGKNSAHGKEEKKIPLLTLDGWERRNERSSHADGSPKAEASVASTRPLSAPLARVWLAPLVRRKNRRREARATLRSHTPPARPDPNRSAPSRSRERPRFGCLYPY